MEEGKKRVLERIYSSVGSAYTVVPCSGVCFNSLGDSFFVILSTHIRSLYHLLDLSETNCNSG